MWVEHFRIGDVPHLSCTSLYCRLVHQDHGTLDNHDTGTGFERSTHSVHSYIRGTASYLLLTLSRYIYSFS